MRWRRGAGWDQGSGRGGVLHAPGLSRGGGAGGGCGGEVLGREDGGAGGDGIACAAGGVCNGAGGLGGVYARREEDVVVAGRAGRGPGRDGALVSAGWAAENKEQC